MSRIDHSISNEAVIPVIQTPEIFDEHPEAQFAAGIIAIGSEVVPGCEEVFHGYGQLRAEVYARQTRMIDPELVREDGTETDEDDARSIHFAVVENTGQPGDKERTQRVVGALRLIIKDEINPAPLPVEEFFPEAFEQEPAAMPSTEASRYICRHEDPRVQNWLSGPLFYGAVSYIVAHGLGETYGVVEPPVEARLKRFGMDLERVADPKWVEEYKDDNLAFRVDVAKLAEAFGLTTEQLAEMREAEGTFSFPAPPPVKTTVDAA